MSMLTTTNVQIINPNDVLSGEQIGKFTKDKQDAIKRLEQQKIDERNALFAAIPKNLTGDQLKQKQEEIDARLKEKNPDPPLSIKKNLGKNGSIIAEHKNKLAFIFIGDVKKAEETTKYKVNAPKISLVVGGGLETTTDPKTGKDTVLDPREDKLVGMSAQLHIVSLADIDVKGILPINFLNNRSAIKTEADVLDLSAREAVIIRSLGTPYNANGARVMTPGGVHIISGQSTDSVKIKEPEPMVLGKGLADTLLEMMNQISQVNSTLLEVIQDILSLKIALLAHVHPGAAGPVPVITTPSPNLIAQVAPTIATKSILNITNCYSNLINFEVLKTNKMLPLSPEKFLSSYNRVN